MDLTFPTLLFVHGAWHGAWAWEPFVGFFRERGYTCRTFDLSGHGSDPQPPDFQSFNVATYVRDLERECAGDETLILVGHSMGGLIIQHYLRTHAARAAIVIGSVPYRGVPLHRLLFLFPHVPCKMIRFIVGQPLAVNKEQIIRKFFYRSHTDLATIEWVLKRVVPESPSGIERHHVQCEKAQPDSPLTTSAAPRSIRNEGSLHDALLPAAARKKVGRG